MEQEMKKRRRGYEEEEEELKKKDSKKRELIGLDSDYDFKFSDSSTGSFQSLGVFDFPWLKEEKQPIEELKFDYDDNDVFSSSLIETSSETSLTEFSGNDEFLVEETTKKKKNNHDHQLVEEEEEDEFYDRTTDSRNDEINGVDCIWSSVLNQPLFTRSSGMIISENQIRPTDL